MIGEPVSRSASPQHSAHTTFRPLRPLRSNQGPSAGSSTGSTYDFDCVGSALAGVDPAKEQEMTTMILVYCEVVGVDAVVDRGGVNAVAGGRRRR